MRMRDKPYKFVVRLPLSMRDRINEAARQYRRSMNSEIVARLQESFSGVGADLQVNDATGLSPGIERLLRAQLDEDEAALIQAFRRLSDEQRTALLKLLRPPTP